VACHRFQPRVDGIETLHSSLSDLIPGTTVEAAP
jgi:hypothetical protein